MAKQADQLIKPDWKPNRSLHSNAPHVAAMKAMMDVNAGESEIRRVAAIYSGLIPAALILNLAHKAWRELTNE